MSLDDTVVEVSSLKRCIQQLPV